ncbi:MAG: hypothetical protein D6755_03390 [Anaerolineae bacterium]|nr:MAG: hypothetical protein D6755_03390 [Anaerolineae bacterium]
MPRKPAFDGVIEAVRYTPEGRIAWVRAHERRGPAFSDHIILSREALIARLRDGKKFVTGKRVLYMGDTFETGAALTLVENGNEIRITTEGNGEGEKLPGVPAI